MAFQSVFRLAFLAAMTLGVACAENAYALSIELKDVAADRVERQRAAAVGALPLPGTPNVAVLQERLRDKGVTLASPILIRIFKSEIRTRDLEAEGQCVRPVCNLPDLSLVRLDRAETQGRR